LGDEYLDHLGDYFVENNIMEKYQITFEMFVILNERGLWKFYAK
jgi:hypothetical protein